MAPSWARAMTADGCPTLLHPDHGQACHDNGGAWAEAQQLHLSGCDLPRRLLRGDHLRLLEVGAAPGWNLAAAYSMASALPGQLHVTAIERSLDALKAGAELCAHQDWKPGAPRGAADAYEAIHVALEAADDSASHGGWVEITPRFKLRLMLGEACDVLGSFEPEECFDAVFLDAFSPGVDPESWSPHFLRALAERIDLKGRLSTFTVSQGVRAALLSGGLDVGCAGFRSGRHSGTWASRGGWVPPLGGRLLAKLKRRSGRLEASEGWVRATSHLE